MASERATTNRKLKETVALELSFVNSNLQLLKEQLAELNSSVELYQNDSCFVGDKRARTSYHLHTPQRGLWIYREGRKTRVAYERL
uniref:Uncharacterized protein n=1 Tax=Timema cristinae TaxID=61476 RepID=A0A7R9CGC2_TIMCR|nr:unnamed protein product [Timema cristinae]